MEIIPAIDIRGGKCVRLYQGDYSQQIVFDEDPIVVALRWHSMGAHWLHIVDLDGAAMGEPQNVAVVEKIVNRSGLLVELGGGIRREETVEELLRKGVNRVILGTVAIQNPELVRRLCRRFTEAVVVGLDAREGKVAIRAWQEDTDTDVLELGREMVEAGVGRFIYTDIKRDGTLTEPNFNVVRELVARLDVPIIASGGISRLEHLRRLKELGAEGAIVGKALYTGDIDLWEAISSL
jgi:phosphoribosylformimino-5-aminoimidazole carboxamide ribotide isomerase